MFTKGNIGLFIFGILCSLFVQPVFNFIGLPSFATLLQNLFGDQKILGVIFSLLLIMFIIFGTNKLIAFIKI